MNDNESHNRLAAPDAEKAKRLELWRSGTPLITAIGRFADADLKEKALQSRSVPPAKIEMPGLDEQPSSNLKSLMQLGLLFAPMVAYSANRKSIIVETQQRMIAKLWDGELVALGYTLPRQVEDAPVFLPHDAWSGTIDWEKSEIRGAGLHFVSVRIARQETTETPLLIEVAPLPPQATKGRPSTKQVIVEAYQALKSSGQIDFTRPMKDCFPQIREWLATRYPDRKGFFLELGKETIRKPISDLFNKDKLL
ncbi:hypothetical protein [Oceanibaculum indicum]|uniref:Uncharacterized protein n=1 Tax=Oceanibaculum indicum TaxID=526216 RepID=A0A420WNB3_9PROT|nr:hypothetical protein [Oceanibaculum indicum]RKQ72503.1 hypothetical protein BCL74_0270 [Oceanibaculum indicum]